MVYWIKNSHNHSGVNIGKLSVLNWLITSDSLGSDLNIFTIKTPTFFLSREEKTALHEEAFPHPKELQKTPQQKSQEHR